TDRARRAAVRARRSGAKRGRRRRPLERCVLHQNRLLEPLQLRPGLEPVYEPDPALAVDSQRVGLAARPVEGEHELTAKALAERVVGDQTLELRHELAVASAAEAGLDAVLERREPRVIEATSLGGRERLAAELSERRTAPERERL